jgi:hypothetical protein
MSASGDVLTVPGMCSCVSCIAAAIVMCWTRCAEQPAMTLTALQHIQPCSGKHLLWAARQLSTSKSAAAWLQSVFFLVCSMCPVVRAVQDNMARIILENGITHVIHFATLLSGKLR